MEYVQLVCALIGVLALIFLFFWILRKVNKGILSVSGKRLKVLDRASLGGEKSVVVVSVAGKCMVLGVTAGRIDKIEDLSITEEEYMSELYPEGSGKQDNVKSNMVYTLCKHMVYMLSITNEHKNELEMRAKPEWKVHFLCFASAKRGSFSIR